ncbi:MAG: DNA mismatch repair protein MutS [Candidatus Omnitrophica bacterium]|nr:DNA mismatch repair protein MutS [Candidatus Omnitrophota bacterium]
MVQQYQRIKASYNDCILFFRLGDFYEMFYEDAKKASAILDLVLTSRGKDSSGKIPMCGVPYHSAESYIAKLIKAGLKVAICEQTEDPSLAKGIVQREVIRVITAGTFIDETNPEARYLACISMDKKNLGLAFTDISNGIIYTNEYSDKNKILEIISKLSVYECIFPQKEEKNIRDIFQNPLLQAKNITLTSYEDWCFNIEIAKKSLCEHFSIHNLSGFGIENYPLAISACGALLEYTKRMNRQPMQHIDKINIYTQDEYVFISPEACYGLELEQLIKKIDYTITSMGKRKLKYWLYHPLKDKMLILQRQMAVKLLKENNSIQKGLEPILHHIPDIEKSLSRISCGYRNPKDILGIRNTILEIPNLQEILLPLSKQNNLFTIEDIPYLRQLLEKTINPDVSLSNADGKLIQKGVNKELDELKDIQENGREWLKNLQAEEIKKTGINSLKIGYNKVFGYYIEISKPNLHLVPQDYIRKQTLVNAERFITPQLKEFEEKMLTAEENILRIEKIIVEDICAKILNNSHLLHQLTERIGTIDALYSLSILSSQPGYIVPRIEEDCEINIKDGRHPVVEQTILEPFVPNDVLLDCNDNHLLIITGPNMAGKSTYIRQVALLVIMAQIGSFIPASSAKIGIVDKIFTRIGAHDEITKGQSTFMVEMTETAAILNNLSPRSLIILDEIGRGTSTYDGFSLAWAIAEYLCKNKVRTLFATHFHELTALGEEYEGVKNYNVAVKEWGDNIVFLHKIIPGGSDESYGIYVAKIAGIPKEVIDRAKQILTRLELHGNLQEKIQSPLRKQQQLSLFSPFNDPLLEKIKDEIKLIDVNNLTPISALNRIQKWKEIIKTYENDPRENKEVSRNLPN